MLKVCNREHKFSLSLAYRCRQKRVVCICIALRRVNVLQALQLIDASVIKLAESPDRRKATRLLGAPVQFSSPLKREQVHSDCVCKQRRAQRPNQRALNSNSNSGKRAGSSRRYLIFLCACRRQSGFSICIGLKSLQRCAFLSRSTQLRLHRMISRVALRKQRDAFIWRLKCIWMINAFNSFIVCALEKAALRVVEWIALVR